MAAVQVNGGEVREIQVNLDPGRLEALGLPLSVVADKLAFENLDLPSGKIIRDGRNISLRTQGEFRDTDEIAERDPALDRRLDRPPEGCRHRRRRLRGARVDHPAERRRCRLVRRAQAVGRQHCRDLRAAFTALLDRVAPSFPTLRIKPIHDDAEFIRSNVEEVRSHIIFGGLMAVLVIFVFMRDWRSTLISALALPTSVIATFFFMYIAGFTINMMTLMALSLVIGILIDDAVVVRENIYRHMEMGEDPVTAARNGTSQIGLAVMATTFTILAVFLPVGFMTGIVGQFFKSFALTIAFAVAMSLLVAFTLDPMLSSRFVRFIPEEERTRTRIGRFFERIGRQYDKLDRRLSPAAAMVAGAAVDRAGSGGVDLRRQPQPVRRDRHRVRAGRGSRPVPGPRRSAARHLVRRERVAGQPASSRLSDRSPKSARCSAPSVSRARCGPRRCR